jgi:membrane protein YqaA with SNARE-associated domain
MDKVLALHGIVVYGLVFAFVFAEDAIFVGFVVPGETAAVLGGVTASRHHAEVALMCLVVVVAAITGDSVGYEVGRKFGPTLLRAPILARQLPRIDAAREFLARRGGAAVFLGEIPEVPRVECGWWPALGYDVRAGRISCWKFLRESGKGTGSWLCHRDRTYRYRVDRYLAAPRT